ncbi:MAG: hypothetical protein WBA00_11475 [Rhodococcus sp. (in: high G+C Gram-positive bacteria)]
MANDIAIVLTALASLVGAVIAGVALLKRTDGENTAALHERVDDLEERAEKAERKAADAAKAHESQMVEINTRIRERDQHIARQDRRLFRLQRYASRLRSLLAERGIDAPEFPNLDEDDSIGGG